MTQKKTLKLPKLIGHRGVKDLCPENTLESILKAFDLGLSFVEIDVKISKDRVPILLHDDTLDRTTNGSGLAIDYDYANIKKLDAGKFFYKENTNIFVPKLEDILSLCTNNYGNLKSAINDIENAINLYNQGIKIAKKKNINSLVFLNHLAVAFQSLNKLTETIETVNKILKIDPNNVNAHQILSSIKKYSLTNEETMNHISQMKKILSEENFGDDQKGIISFALGKAYDDLKDSDEAIKFLSIGNKMMHKIRNSNIAEEINTINDMKKNKAKELLWFLEHNSIFTAGTSAKEIDQNIKDKNLNFMRYLWNLQ